MAIVSSDKATAIDSSTRSIWLRGLRDRSAWEQMTSELVHKSSVGANGLSIL